MSNLTKVIEQINRLVQRDELGRAVPRVECADGFSMSVQAGVYLYCTPQCASPSYMSVEIGFPSARVDAFMDYIDGSEDDDPTGTVYGYVPIEIVAQTIIDHGGFARATGEAA